MGRRNCIHDTDCRSFLPGISVRDASKEERMLSFCQLAFRECNLRMSVHEFVFFSFRKAIKQGVSLI